ncbi:protein of unknown function [Rhodovastum atsumiense]|nr:protein of unknown function [Rhodovastum atsumiense]
MTTPVRGKYFYAASILTECSHAHNEN